MKFFSQICLILVVLSHGWPSNSGYAPGPSNFNTTAALRNKCPPINSSNSSGYDIVSSSETLAKSSSCMCWLNVSSFELLSICNSGIALSSSLASN